MAVLDDEALVEEFADLHRSAFPRIAARMVALLVLEDGELSSQDFVARLRVSPSSVSTMGRLLIRSGVVQRRVSPETRADMYSMTPDAWLQNWTDAQGLNVKIVDWAERAASLKPQAHNTALTGIRDFSSFLAAELPGLIDRYRQLHGESD